MRFLALAVKIQYWRSPGDNVARADEELRLYRDGDETSEMAYAKWADIHATLEVALTRLGEDAQKQSKLAGVEPGTITFLWPIGC